LKNLEEKERGHTKIVKMYKISFTKTTITMSMTKKKPWKNN